MSKAKRKVKKPARRQAAKKKPARKFTDGELVIVSKRPSGIANQVGRIDGRGAGTVGIQFALDESLQRRDYNDFDWINPDLVKITRLSEAKK